MKTITVPGKTTAIGVRLTPIAAINTVSATDGATEPPAPCVHPVGLFVLYTSLNYGVDGDEDYYTSEWVSSKPNYYSEELFALKWADSVTDGCDIVWSCVADWDGGTPEMAFNLIETPDGHTASLQPAGPWMSCDQWPYSITVTATVNDTPFSSTVYMHPV